MTVIPYMLVALVICVNPDKRYLEAFPHTNVYNCTWQVQISPTAPCYIAGLAGMMGEYTSFRIPIYKQQYWPAFGSKCQSASRLNCSQVAISNATRTSPLK